MLRRFKDLHRHAIRGVCQITLRGPAPSGASTALVREELPPQVFHDTQRRIARRLFTTGRSLHSPQHVYERTKAASSEHALYLVGMTVALVGATYGAVPVYRMFCAATGYGGTVQEGASVEAKLRAREENPNAEVETAAAARQLTVSFNADVSDGMPWKFVPTQRSIKIRPGESSLAFYTATNLSDHAITGVSTYNVTPMQAGVYFNKIQCFCFEEQKLRPGESIDMPIFFYVDPEYATDPRLKHINALTLSYTFFKVSEDEVEAGEEGLPAAAPLPSGAPAPQATA
ncbi:COX11 [Auxenochlorella protothecoides x Auxenochlorella symbiontica]